mmetsp:Transcript_20463/g.59330  ORF Transcript_20463/g.59330 Transcript_20463/m.59330 type:complete len:213 (+) Transcript_20463:104-742(+)
MRVILSSASLLHLISYSATLCDAWVVRRHGQAKMSLVVNPFTNRRRNAFVHYSGPFFGPEEEFTCPDEEECEIDWDQMPGFDEPDEEGEDEADVDMQPPPSYGMQALLSLDKRRVNLEMNWQMEECETDADSCTDFCEECAGSGRQPCRFCRGTGMFSVGTDIRPCLVCSKYAIRGQEDCSTCRGTGQIAPWASTMEGYMKDDHEEKNYTGI